MNNKMKKQIWKYPLAFQAGPGAAQWVVNEIAMPEDSQLLGMLVQGGVPVIYSMGVPEAKRKIRIVKIYGTGHDIDEPVLVTDRSGHPLGLDAFTYIGSFQVGWFVGHVFDYGWK